MPTANVVQIDGMNLYTYLLFPVIYNGKLFLIMHDAGYTKIFNVDDKVGAEITDTGDPNRLGGLVRLVDFKAVTSSTYILRVLHQRSGTLVLSSLEVDLNAMTATRVEEATYSLAWISASEEMAHSIVIPPYLWIAPNKEDSYLHYVNLDDGSDVSFDTGLGGYFARPSPKYIHYNDDIYMLLGVHLAGSNFRLLKLYSKTVTDLGFSAGGGSPRVQVGNMSWFHNDIIIPATCGGVDNADNDIKLLDKRFNVKSTIDLASLTGWSSNDAMGCGINIFAKRRDGTRYYGVLGVYNNSDAKATATKVFLIELDQNLNVVSSSLILDLSVRAGFAIGRDYTDFFNRPVFVVNRKKIYVFGQSGEPISYIIEIDVSDIFNDVEFNKNLWILQSRIPTSLTLQVTPL